MSTTGDARGPSTVPAASPGPSATPPAPGLPFTLQGAQRAGRVRRFFLRHPRAMDAFVVAWFAVPSLGIAVADPQPGRAVGPTVALVVAGAATLALRRRAPVLVALATAVLAAVTSVVAAALTGFDFALAFALYAVASLRPARVAWPVAAVTFGIVSGTILAVGDPTVLVEDAPLSPEARWAEVTGVLVLALGAMSVGISVRNRRLHLLDLVERANALARERDRQAELALAGQRTRIAREMHDVVAHSLSVMIALADGASAALERSPDRSRAALDELAGTGRSALADMRRILGVLQDVGTPLEPQPGAVDLEGLVERFRTAGLPVRTTGLSTPLPDDAGLQLAVFRIVQESLTNALRHAPGAEVVDVVLGRDDDGVVIEVTDDGATLPGGETGGAGQGLIGMRERAAVYGGGVTAGPHGTGWRVTARLPWDGTAGTAEGERA
ncbi:histidine kinase [Actinotalea ferrariae CF5-4]|uniref:histidine kinase n=1 Tax=Actinotalea ferrariae CF5-4 TaxID=948458 RepID=A0A021VWF1_9CELL|nr:histidine kinase [Actinotalea ferrariae]EYR63377.1 histidine kinase [Actinotalea ferrariae CF5-4]